MATYLPSSGAISINDINTLFGRGNNLNAYRGTQYYTSSAGPFTFSAGAIDMNSFHGTGPTANTFSFSIAGGQNVNLRSSAVSAGWNQASPLVCTISANIGSTSTGSPALTIAGSFPGGLSVTINSGVYVVGAGGAGGAGSTSTAPGISGGAGGLALSVSSAVTITNNGVVGGGGGGGGGGQADSVNCCGAITYYQGGGGGGGAGYSIGAGAAWSTGQTAATITNGGRGGNSRQFGNAGVAGGSAGVAGTSSNTDGGAGGGGLGAAGGRCNIPTYNTGGAAGAATSGNANITWAATGTRYGALN